MLLTMTMKYKLNSFEIRITLYQFIITSQCLTAELYKVFSGISLDIIKNVLPFNSSCSYIIRNRTFYSRPVNLVYKATESLLQLAQKIRNLAPNHIKSLSTLPQFKNTRKFQRTVRCTLRTCRTYIPPIGFMYWIQFQVFVFISYCVEYGNFVWFLVGKTFCGWVVITDFWMILPRASQKCCPAGSFRRGIR